jgi:hypothetical protein
MHADMVGLSLPLLLLANLNLVAGRCSQDLL